MSQPMQACRSDDPLMVAWNEYRKTEDFSNAFNWATRVHAYEQGPNGGEKPATTVQRGDWVKGSFWAMFMAGYLAATERAAMLHESVNPASDAERENHVPGAGAMGAVIQYRDLIRQRTP